VVAQFKNPHFQALKPCNTFRIASTTTDISSALLNRSKLNQDMKRLYFCNNAISSCEGSMTAKTSGSICVVALLSRYIIYFTENL
jgi:hypothetical protein